MVVEVETLASSMTEGKMARDCDACTKGSRACWYCPADDAFLCQTCDASIHSANQLAKRHERVRLQSSTLSPVKTTSVWYEGFTRKARTPRNKGGSGLEKVSQVQSNDPLVPELGREEVQEQDGLFSFSSTDENEESLNYLVPVFDPFSDMATDDGSSFDLFPDGVDIDINGKELGDDDGLIGGFLPMDMDLAELAMDVESLLKEEPNLGVKVEGDLGFEINRKPLDSVKDEVVEVEQKCEIEEQVEKKSLFLSLDYESVVTAWGSHGSPWQTGTKPELDSWPEVQLRGYTCPSNMVGWEPHQQRRSRGGSDGDREARVLRYKEKRRTRLFAKKIRYEVRKLNAEQRPRIKGRFVKRSSL